MQDDWRLRPGLSLSGGLRYETQTNAHDWSDIAPRLGLAWAIGKPQSGVVKNVIRAGFGIFYDRLSESLTLDALRQNGIRQQQFLISNPTFYPAIPSLASLASGALPQTIRETDAQWRAPAMYQMAIAYERQLPKHVTVSTNYVHTAGVPWLRSRNINAPLPGPGVRPFGGLNSIYLYETSGVYRQSQLTTSVNARINSRLSLTGYYFYGKAMSNSDGAGTFPANQYDLSTEYDRAGFDIRHRLQFNGSIATRWGFRFSPFLTLTSGRPYNITTGADLNGDGLFADRPSFAANPAAPGVRITRYGALNATPLPGETIIPRNFAEGPGLIAANLRVARIFNLGEHSAGKDSERQLVFSVNARNILNHPN
ncbi:MAG: TonB-dependent receptor, partial [Acidobacteriota bacterium]|nr:TonB-dependent receptor [Acidobacteriota bacterium]